MKELSKKDNTEGVLWLSLTALHHIYSEREQQVEQKEIKMYSTGYKGERGGYKVEREMWRILEKLKRGRNSVWSKYTYSRMYKQNKKF